MMNLQLTRLLTSLDFRTTYEAGIPVKDLDNDASNIEFTVSI